MKTINIIFLIILYFIKCPDFVKNEETSAKSISSTLFWGPDIITNSSGKASISFFNNNKSTGVTISVNGIAGTRLFGRSTIQFSVK